MTLLRPLILSALLGLAACGPDAPEVVVAPPPEMVQVAQVTTLDVGQTRNGIMIVAHARDARGLVEELSFIPRGIVGGLLSFDLMGGYAQDFMAADMPPQNARAAMVLSAREARGAIGVRVNGAQGSAQYLFPQIEAE